MTRPPSTSPAARRLRYLVITEKYLPRKGGSNMWYHEVYRRLGDRTTHIVCADQPGAVEFDATHPNRIHRARLQRHPWLRPESLWMYLKLLAMALWVGVRYGCDRVHAGRALPEGLVGWLVAGLLRKPLVIYCHGEELTTWTQPLKQRFMRFAYRRADRIVANSGWTRSELLRLGIDPAPIRLVYPGVDVERFRPGLPSDDLRQRLGLGAEERIVLGVGRLTRRKGFDQVIRALPGLSARGIPVHYAIVGIGDDRRYLTGLAEQLGVAERVHLLGHVDEDELPRWYNAAAVLALVNREIDGDTEGFGLVFLEAAACGRAAIAGRAGGTGDAVQEGVTGLRVDGADSAAVEDALARLLGDPEYAEALGAKGRERACREFAWERVAEKTRAL
jgi:phosphatidylinositol alpha-1,6-mannosyltransferase